ncbi:kinase-like protein [Annulohypoxylon maeteangense]|uniref:kinase-like protein n=1 Tax=Annulohypoxylon maeteangense TaxID=1927788 RepID=UPI002008011D|nr:kinase-like protein [Annulohypoxylon maeteangense]KAI0880960.1 kinase-like protein [Annulohypoxylon maeteangense]
MEIVDESFKDDPFMRHGKEPLGKSNSEVWKVARKSDGKVYARKEFPAPRRDNKEMNEKIKKEIFIMTTAKHHHIVKLCGSHYIESSQTIGLLILPVAEMNLAEYLEVWGRNHVNEFEQQKARRNMCQWPPCLFQVLDYLHDAGFRHKDIKPSNILIKDGQVYLADFGISSNFRDSNTSKTKGPAGAITERYIAPEIDNELARGRASDVWALGCTVLEICTVALGENSIEDLNEHLHQGPSSRPTPFCRSPYLVFDWIWLHLVCSGKDEFCRRPIQKMLQLAFLMLDPNPNTRINVRQLVDLLNKLGSNHFHSLGQAACDECKRTSHVPLHNFPLHSVFREEPDGSTYIPLKDNISSKTQDLWEEVKRRWLVSHIWWEMKR